MRRAVLLLLVLAVVAAAPAVATAQDNPFGPLPQSANPTPAPTTAQTTTDQSSVSRPLLLGIAGAVALVFLGIGVFITRDARTHLTEADRATVEGTRRRELGDRKQAERAKQRARSKGKAQRQARKAHRRR